MKLQAPFPYFGGKSKISDIVWSRFGDVKHYIEPFAGSLAVLLARPHDVSTQLETVGDLNGFLANFWRALQDAPEELAQRAGGPLLEVDMHAQRKALVTSEEHLTQALLCDDKYYDIEKAAHWVQGICSWIGKGYPYVSNRSRPQLHSGDGIYSLTRRNDLPTLFGHLSSRIKNVRICCSSWEKLVSPYVLHGKSGTGITGVFLDPPYTDKAGREDDLYGIDSLQVGYEVASWAIENGDNPNLRIAVCGYQGEYTFPSTWEEVAWSTQGGMSNFSDQENKNSSKERVWFSPHCMTLDASWENSPVYSVLQFLS